MCICLWQSLIILDKDGSTFMDKDGSTFMDKDGSTFMDKDACVYATDVRHCQFDWVYKRCSTCGCIKGAVPVGGCIKGAVSVERQFDWVYKRCSTCGTSA